LIDFELLHNSTGAIIVFVCLYASYSS